jgi:hypothetical protein
MISSKCHEGIGIYSESQIHILHWLFQTPRRCCPHLPSSDFLCLVDDGVVKVRYVSQSKLTPHPQHTNLHTSANCLAVFNSIFNTFHIVTILNLCVTMDRVWIGYWIYWPLPYTTRTTCDYRAIANLHTLQITAALAKPSSSLLCIQQSFPSNGF